MSRAPRIPTELKHYNTLTEVAAYLTAQGMTISSKTLYRMCESYPPRMGHVHSGSGFGRIWIRDVDVAAYLEANTHEVKVS